jgi:putative heme-binding domain-containing protein
MTRLPLACLYNTLLVSIAVCIPLAGDLFAQQDSTRSGFDEQRISELAGNAQVAEILRNRPGRGVMADDSNPTAPHDALATFRLSEDLSIELVASEPEISQPLFLSWDSAGRMWVVQYRQYQYPAGLKVVRFDQHLRAVYDRQPPPPPDHVPGADIITVFEDTDGDGSYDQHRNVIEGLNIATSVAVGRGGIWVLNPPYLLFYPDADQDTLPDADPEVHLSGFGLQDTHSVANSLLWGPDGWLYGANGSTTSGRVASAATSAVEFEGQCIWRYHPATRHFEIYAEGGGNTFSLDIDAGGRVFSGTNGGGTRGWYYPQGSYSQKNWGKHGPLTNPYAFGFLDPMKLSGDQRRFPQAFLIYEGGLLGKRYEGCVIAPNSMHNLVWLSRREPDGSTFQTTDQPNLLESADRWFRPVYAGVGPDGAVYLADWYDTRLSHVSPMDDWHKSSGRIYRVAPGIHDSTNSPSETNHSAYRLSLLPVQNLLSMDDSQLLDCLSHPNKWTRQRAAMEIGWRNRLTLAPQLIRVIDQQSSLEALWALNGLGQLTSQLATKWCSHPSPDIRRWVVRLLGDRRESLTSLIDMPENEPDAQVRSQLAATAKRIDASTALPLIGKLLLHPEDATDPHIPLMIWWALEAHADEFESVLQLLTQADLWQSSIMTDFLAERLTQRYASQSSSQGLERCSRLLDLPLQPSQRSKLILGINKAFQGRTLPVRLPENVRRAIDEYRQSLGQSGSLLAARQGDTQALTQLYQWLQDDSQDMSVRLECAEILGQRGYSDAVDTLLRLATGQYTQEPALQRVALQSLIHFDGQHIGSVLVRHFDSTISAEHDLRDTACRTLSARKPWALSLLQEIDQWRIRKQDIPPDVISQLRLHSDPQVASLVDQIFGQSTAISEPEQLVEMERLTELLQPLLPSARHPSTPVDVSFSPGASDNSNEIPFKSSGTQGNSTLNPEGQLLYMQRCGKCHQLFGAGERIGPPLDNYDRQNLKFWLTAIVAPSAEIREGFQSYSLVTDDGRVLTGMIAAQDLKSTTLQTADQQLITVAKENILELQAMQVSLMPQGTLSDLNDQQIRMLFQYLSSPAP